VKRSLIIPKHLVKEAEKRGHKVNRAKSAALREASRPRNVSEATWVDRMASRRNAILLCGNCQPKFDPKRHNYYRDRKFTHVQGKCDGCQGYSLQAALYIHESFLADPGGRTRKGQCWTPK